MEGYLLHLVFHTKNVVTKYIVWYSTIQLNKTLGYISSFDIYKLMYWFCKFMMLFWILFCQFVASCCRSLCCKYYICLHCKLIVVGQFVGFYTHKIQNLLQGSLLHLMFHTNDVVAIQPFNEVKPWRTFLHLIFTNS